MSDMDYKKLREHKRSHGGRTCYKDGGHVEHEDEKQDKKLIKKMVSKAKIKLKSGGEVDGEKAHKRADKRERFSRGGGHKHKGGKDAHTKVNVIVAGGGGQNPGSAPMMPAPRPPITPPPAMPPQGGMPPRPPMPPQGGAPGGGMPSPMMRNAGGRVGKQEKAHDKERRKVDIEKSAYRSEIGKPEKEHDRTHHHNAFKKPEYRKQGGKC